MKERKVIDRYKRSKECYWINNRSVAPCLHCIWYNNMFSYCECPKTGRKPIK